MPRLRKPLILALATVALPCLALRAQQPTAPTTPADQPTARDVVKSIEESKAASQRKASDPIERIKEEGLKRSKVMETLSYLTDVIGPRLSGSPAMKRANEWTRDRLACWGLENAHLEPWGTFGRGWTLERFSAQVVAPQCIPLIAVPKAWSPGTDGPLVADVILVEAKTEDDLARYKGKLRGAIVLAGPPRDLAARFEPLAVRLTDHDLLTLADASETVLRRQPARPAPERPATSAASNTEDQETKKPQTAAEGGGGGGGARGAGDAPAPAEGRPPSPDARGRARLEFLRKQFRFLIDEGAALVVDPSQAGDGGTLFVGAASFPTAAPLPPPGSQGRRPAIWDKDAPATIPQLVLATEHYNRLARMIRQGESIRMEVNLSVRFHDDDLKGYNTIAEIPGGDLKDEVVMLGGHMDSWHGGTGATDNAAGVAVAMEAVRILKALELKPRRTIRIALWSGEEQGLLGSRGYVEEHLGKRNPPPRRGESSSSSEGEASKRDEGSPVVDRKPEYEKFSAYYNLDNGSGKIRGVYLQGNEGVRPLFRSWLQPFRAMGASTLTIADTGGTDHQSFDGIGLPGFQFIQDGIEYRTRTHHSNQDVYDRIQADDLKQSAAIMAAFVYNTAMRDEKIPRKPAAR